MCVAVTYMHQHYLEAMIDQLEHVCASPKWHARRAAIEFVQNMVFCNLFNARPYAQRFKHLVFKCLFDEQFEVRTVASVTLSGFYQCGFIDITKDDLVCSPRFTLSLRSSRFYLHSFARNTFE